MSASDASDGSLFQLAADEETKKDDSYDAMKATMYVLCCEPVCHVVFLSPLNGPNSVMQTIIMQCRAVRSAFVRAAASCVALCYI